MVRKAICCGINDYPGTNSDLAGCVNDANDMAAVLFKRGFQTTKLLDSQATKNAIVTTIRDTLAGMSAGDQFVFFYSGHGTWLPSTTEPDRHDEALCPWDILLDEQNVLLDDEIASLLNARPAGIQATLVTDSCFSGTVAQMTEPPPEEIHPKFMPHSEFVKDPRTRLAIAGVVAAPGPTGPWLSNTVHLSASSDAEYAYETKFKNRANGVFTYHALQVLKTLPSAATYRQWFAAIRKKLPTRAYPQTPQLHASKTPASYRVFG